MKTVDWVTWGKAALIRGVRTFAEAMLAYIGTGALVLGDVNWVAALSAGGFGFVSALLLALTGLPEAVQQDPLFALLVKDELLKAPDSKLELMTLENDPDAKITKNEKPVKNTKTAKAVKAVKTETAAKTEKTGKTEKSAMEPAKTENAAVAAEAKADAGQNDTK